MHIYKLDNWQHKHNFEVDNKKAERRTLYVLFLTATTMIVEIIAGSMFGSMALLADGWHMGTHVAAFTITIIAYKYARKHARDPIYSFGTGKVNVLGGFASAVALAVVALMIFVESLERVFNPHTIYFNEAIAVACVGLVINLFSAFLLKDEHHHHGHHHHHHEHGHHHEHEHEHEHEHHHEEDHNLRAAYIHVLADATTSLFAIIALIFGKYLGWNWLDPIMGIVGTIIITRWAYGLLKDTSPILLDASLKNANKDRIIKTIEADRDNRVVDLHIWQLGANHYATIVSLVTHYPETAQYYKNLLKDFKDLEHITIEINVCKDKPCIPLNNNAKSHN